VSAAGATVVPRARARRALARPAVGRREEVVAQEGQADAEHLGQDEVPVPLLPDRRERARDSVVLPVGMKELFAGDDHERHGRVGDGLVERGQSGSVVGGEAMAE